ncbi:hypothetical protein ACHQM5_013901 [Ranunculus cassubicifolius]
MEVENMLKIVEERTEKMVPHTGGTPIIRTSRFLNPSSTPSINPLIPSFPKPQPCRLQECLTEVHFRGWRSPQLKWGAWVSQMTPIYESIWKKVGIFDSIIMSTYQFIKDTELIWGLVDSWCPDTNSFVFSWGEATMTLEDMSVIGGFSVLGEPVTSPLTEDMLEIQEILIKEHMSMTMGNIKQARKARHCEWIRGFMGRDDELEHIAFLSLWLSRYVFPTWPEETIGMQIFPIAIQLSRGIRIALAPAILASLYSDLRKLKEQLVASATADGYENDELPLNIWAPFQMMQLWAWERFPSLQPTPNPLKSGEPRSARWHRVKSTMKFDSVRSSIHLPDEFLWRPYSSVLNNWKRPLYYKDQAEWITLTPDMIKESEELQSFIHFIVPCELVGLECIEQYLPHRVGMQFGMDQDIPGHFSRANANWEIAWNTYNVPTRNTSLYIPPRLFESDVTVRYFDWWKLNFSAELGDMIKEASSDQSNSSDVESSKKSEGPVSLNDESSSYGITTSGWHKRKNNVPSDQVQTLCSTTKRNISVEEPMINLYSEVPKEISIVYEDNDGKTRDSADILLQTCRQEVMPDTAELQIPGLELEARIDKIEMVVHWLTMKFVARKKKKKKTSSEAASHA